MRSLAKLLSDLGRTGEPPLELPSHGVDGGAEKQILRKQLLLERERERLAAAPGEWGAAQAELALHSLRKEAGEARWKAKLPRFGAYLPIRGELDLREAATPDWILPVTSTGGRMRWFRLGDSSGQLVLGRYGIPEVPWENARDLEDWGERIVLFVPALAASRSGDRLGYGGGFYDRLLAQHRQRVFSVCCVPRMGFFDALPRDPWDEPVDAVRTVDGWHRTSKRSFADWLGEGDSPA